MRRAIGIALVAGAVVGLALTARGNGRTTYDTLRVIVPARSGAEYVLAFGWQTTGPVSLPSLGVFRRRATTRDIVPPPWRLFAQGMHADLTRTRLLLAAKGVRIYAFPSSDRDLCYLRVPPTAGSACTRSFIDDAFPQVNAWHDTWGIVDDATVRVDVDGTRAILGENAFYSRLPPGTPAPHTITVYERGGVKHVYDVHACPFDGTLGPLDC